MRRLTAALRVRLRRRGGLERGASASIVLVLLGGGVLLGAAALTLDVGNILWERRQLQNSADAASMALAQLCSHDVAQCAGSAMAGLTALANANAADNAAAFDTSVYAHGACGRGIAGLPECQAPSGALVDCPPVPPSVPSTVKFVQVYTSTRTGSGGNILPPFVAETFGYGGTNVKACARAAWGAPGTYAATVPMTFSVCEWRGDTNADPFAVPPVPRTYVDGPSGAAPGYGGAAPQPPWPQASDEVTFMLQTHSTSTCANWQGHDVPGGFGYLTENGCRAMVVTGGWVQIDTGASAPCALASMRGRVVDLPIFDCTARSVSGAPTQTVEEIRDGGGTCAEGTGNNTWYHIAGWAKFYVSGYRISGGSGPDQSEPSYVTGAVPCASGDRCISGWFVDGLLRDASSLGGGGDFGAQVVLPAG